MTLSVGWDMSKAELSCNIDACELGTAFLKGILAVFILDVFKFSDPALSPSGSNPRETLHGYPRRHIQPTEAYSKMFIALLFTVAEN